MVLQVRVPTRTSATRFRSEFEGAVTERLRLDVLRALGRDHGHASVTVNVLSVVAAEENAFQSLAQLQSELSGDDALAPIATTTTALRVTLQLLLDRLVG